MLLEELCSSFPVVEGKVKNEVGDDDVLDSKFLQRKLPTKVTNKPFMNPCNPGSHIPINRGNQNASKPLFEPSAPDALVLPEPEWDHQVNNNIKRE